jgi:hypothetical protein
MSVFARIPPLLVMAVAVACASPSTGVTEERSGNAAATITSSPSATGDGTGAEGSAGAGADGQDGQDGQDGRSSLGEDAGGKDTGTPPTSSRGPGGSSFAVTNNDVLIGAAFASVDEYSFGSTSSGSTTTRSMSVGSNREATVTSVDVISTTGAFRLVDDGCTGVRFPGPSCRVRVAATPPTVGEHEGVLEIYYTTAAGESRSSGRDLTVSGEQDGSEEDTTEPEVRQESTTESPPTTSG